MFSNLLANIASFLSGADSKLTYFLWFDNVDCPKELIK